jgi:hypothetical protein
VLKELPNTPAAAIKRRPRSHIAISGQRIAKNHLDPRVRAELAASWVLGSLTVDRPTYRQASDAFGVCEALIREALRRLEATTTPPTSSIDAVWDTLSAYGRDEFIRARFDEIWATLERVTD